ncbi:MAG: hypothetical protein ACQESA_02750 [Patescibacteria group bacterium]
MVYNISQTLQERFKQTVKKMESENLKREYISGESFFVTTEPDKEPRGTLFLGALEGEDRQEYVLCQQI